MNQLQHVIFLSSFCAMLSANLSIVAGNRIEASPILGVRPMVHDAAVYLDQTLALPITGKGDTTITQPGWYVLANDLINNNTASDLIIDADYVTLDLYGYIVKGCNKGITIKAGRNHINIQNGKIARNTTCSGPATHGIFIESPGSNTVTMQDLMISNVVHGIGLDTVSELVIRRVIISESDIGIAASDCSNMSIADCQILNQDVRGIYLEHCARVTIDRTSVLNSEAPGFELFKCTDAVCDHCQVLGLLANEVKNGFAFYCEGGQGVIFQNCTVENVESTSTSVVDQAVGILLSPEQRLPPESITDEILGLEHVVRNCTVNKVFADYGAQAYGIRLDFLFPELPWFCNNDDSKSSPPFSVGVVYSIDWTLDGTYMAATGENGVAIYKFLPLATFGDQLVQVTHLDFYTENIPGPSWAVRWDPSGTDRILFGDDIDGIYVYQFDRSTETLTYIDSAIVPYSTSIWYAAWHPTGRYVAAGTLNGWICVYPVTASGIGPIAASVTRGDESYAEVWLINWSPVPDPITGNYYLASVGNSMVVPPDINPSEIEVWEFEESPASLNLIATNSAEPHNSTITSVVWHPSGDYIAMGGDLSWGGGQNTLNDIRIYKFLPTIPPSPAVITGSLLWFTDANKAHNPSNYLEIQELYVDWEPSGRYLGVGGLSVLDDRLSPAGYVDSRVYAFEPWQGTGSNALPWLYDGIPPHNEIEYYDYSVWTIEWSPDGRWFGVGANEADSYGTNIRVYKGLFYPKRCLIHENVVNNVEAQTVIEVFNAGIEGENVVFPGIGNAMTKNKASNCTRNYGYGTQYVDGINVFDHLYNIEFP